MMIEVLNDQMLIEDIIRISMVILVMLHMLNADVNVLC